MHLTKSHRDRLIASIRADMREYHTAHLTGPIEWHCLFWAFFTMQRLRAAGVKSAQLQAGTAYWPILTPETDDGVSPTQVGYEFNKIEAREWLLHGQLPEMHCWVAITDKPIELIDLTSFYFKGQALGHKFRYTAPDPPDYLWCRMDQVPEGVRYRADADAMNIAYTFLKHAISGAPLVFTL